VATTTEDLNSRLERLERDFRDFSSEVSASMRIRGQGDSALHRISLMAWLQISGPTLATLAFGFTLLWNAQQAQTASMLEVQRSVGRLEGSISGLDTRVISLEGSIQGLDARVGSLEGSINRLDTRIDKLDARIDKLGNAIDALAKRLGSS
jgi:outer membrane murein-binding lipoprotein Lpp